MRQGTMAACCIAAAGMIAFGCSNDSEAVKGGCAQCGAGQVCSGGGICYDNPDCVLCGRGEVCVGGICYADTDACARCGADDVCSHGKCYDAEDPCAQCTVSQVCRAGKCYAADDSCLVCGDEQVCVGGVCYDKGSPCARCGADQVCNKEVCYDKGDACAGCTDGEWCVGGKCESVDPGACYPACGTGEVCAGGECRQCPVACEEACCEADEQCDAYLGMCVPQCEGGAASCFGKCCDSGQTCHMELGCVTSCAPGELLCVNGMTYDIQCCASGMVCESGRCLEDCGATGLRCGEACCTAGQVCEDGRCKIACDGATQTRCGLEENLCCNNDSQICFSNKCLIRGKSCVKASDCEFDEICDEGSQTCVKSDEVVSSCEVKPNFGEFKPLLQFNWPKCLPGGVPSEYSKYIRVIIMPMAANMTDDNGDGVVDENDVPDIIFIAYSTDVGPDHQAPSVLRVISGDDGHEIASSAPRYWTYPIDAVVADIDNDGKNEIILGTNNHRKYSETLDWTTGETDKIEALGVEPDPASATGYKLVQKYAIEMNNGVKLSFLSVADLDSDGVPEVLTNQGVVSVVDGKFAWRSGCGNRSMGYPHAADLDGDGIMEIVTSSGIYDDHCNKLASNGGGGNIAVADLMPSGADAAETGELVPEIAHVISGKFEGKFQFRKVYKKLQEDGTYQWSVQKAWEAPIPIDWERAKNRGCADTSSTSNSCYTGGGTPVIADFNGDTIPDIGVASRYYYIVYSNDGTPNGGRVLWADGKTQDYSSAVTGSSVFDFEGDGKAEVVYADETMLRIYAGEGSGVDADGDGYNDPKIIWQIANLSATGYEYPIIVDVDNDGSTEIVLSSDMGNTMGINVYEDPGAQWVRTRRIWNQHHYHVTNINEDGSVPRHEMPNWTHPKLNNYRQNVQPSGMFNAPNLVADAIASNTDNCEAGKKVTLTAHLSNQGSLGVKAGLGVKFYVEDINGTGQKAPIGTAHVAKSVMPGQTASASLEWDQYVQLDGDAVRVKSPAKISFVIDEPTDEKVYGEFVECVETDNALLSEGLEICDFKVN